MAPIARVVFLSSLVAVLVGAANEGWADSGENKPLNRIVGSIGGLVDESSRIGKELKVSMEMAVEDFHLQFSSCSKVALKLSDSGGKLARSAVAVTDLVSSQNTQALIGTVTLEEAALLSISDKIPKNIPIVSVLPTPSYPPPLPSELHHLIRLGSDVTAHMKCIAAIVHHFRWRQVMAIYEHNRLGFPSSDSELLIQLSEKLEAVGSAVKRGSAFPPLASLSNPRAFVEEELKKLRRKSNRVFSYKNFKLKFRRKYRIKYPEDEEYPNPSVFALRAYDATWAIAKALERSTSSIELLKAILGTEFTGLSGNISFKNGELSPSPTFEIINVVGRSYRVITLWSAESGFSGELGFVYWSGGLQTVPKGWSLGSDDRPLKIGVPARGAFYQFVRVSYNQERNGTFVSGFSVDVFKVVVRKLNYHLPYRMVPFPGSYDEMVAAVHNKSLDAAVGDISVMADRYEQVEFSQPYMESTLVMVVAAQPDKTKEIWMFMNAFKVEMWLLTPMLQVFTGTVVWLIERAENNKDFEGPFLHRIGTILWFSITLLFLAQRESIKSNWSRIILALWLFVMLTVAACFTAVLSSMITVSRLQQPTLDIEHLKSTNATVGCNGKSFISRYLKNDLQFKLQNIRKLDSICDYKRAFESGEIVAAFLVEPHAKVFLAKYCVGYTIAGSRFKLGGFGFAFPKGSALAIDISEAILKTAESGEIRRMEKHMLSLSNCSAPSTKYKNSPSLGIWPFAGLFIISGGVSLFAFLLTVGRLMDRNSREP
ncbi:hypothetical protein NMG60_11016436 [Bertholletia excelsa]